MKPSFALVLTQDSLGLLHRTPQGWDRVGAADVSDPALYDALSHLRDAALVLQPEGITTKLVIPNSEILFITVRAPGPSPSARRSQIRAALEGRTPYDVGDLVFDWEGSGPEVQVAVVARETLDEAEAFATQYRLGPVSYVGSPKAAIFKGEPWFGPTHAAATLLKPGEKVERDNSPVAPAALEPRPAEAVAEAPAPMPDLPPEPVVTLPDPIPPMPAEVVTGTLADPMPASEPAQEPKAVESVAPPPEPEPEAAVPALPESVPPTPETFSRPVPADAVPPPLARAARPDVIAQGLDEPVDRPEAKPAVASSAPAIERLKARLAEQPSGSNRFGGRVPGPLSPPPPLGPAGAAPAAARPPRPAAPAGPSARAPAAISRPMAAARNGVKAAARGAASMVTAPSIPMPRDRRVNIPVADPSGETRARSADSRKPAQADGAELTSFGGKQTRRGKPRHLGLLLTAALLILLAAVAAWSTFLASKDTAETPAVAEAPAGTAAPDPVATAVPAPVSAPDPSQDQPAAPAETAPQAAVSAVAPEPQAAPTIATSGSSTEATRTATTPPPPRPAITAEAGRNPVAEPQDEIFLAQTDPTVPTGEAIALAPPVAATDPAPAQQPLPPPFGTVYQFDAEGLIIPTPEGIVTPDGVLLVLGRPDVVPPARPAAFAQPAVPLSVPETVVAPAEPNAAAASVAGVALLPAEPATEEPALVSDPALVGARPRSRPADLVPPSTDDDAALELVAETQVTSLRPRARPAALLVEAEPVQAEETAALQSAAASLAATAPQDPSISPQAVAVSRKPAARPRDLSRAVEAAVASIAQAPIAAAPPPEEPVVVMSAPAPEPEPAAPARAAKPAEDHEGAEIDEPEVASAEPNVPTRANVARQATFRNAINLSRINLIGVYGSASNRYALVRQPNGRYVKVEVGDRVDGGRVAAITEREVRYEKNGRTVTLEMPKS